MPLAWDATAGTLTVRKAAIPFDEKVVADFQRHPFHLIKGSVATPPEGIITKLITEDQMFTGEDAKGAMILAGADTRPQHGIYSDAADFGALGVVTDNVRIAEAAARSGFLVHLLASPKPRAVAGPRLHLHEGLAKFKESLAGEPIPKT